MAVLASGVGVFGIAMAEDVPECPIMVRRGSWGERVHCLFDTHHRIL